MASEIIGRMACPECGFHAAHVKIKTDKEGAHPYRHCPDCGAQFFTRTKLQADNLKAQIRQATQTQTQTQTPAPARVVDEAQLDGQAPVQQFKTVFGVRVPV